MSENSGQGANPKYPEGPLRDNRLPLRRHYDDDYWDRITIQADGVRFLACILPRWKTSGLSGDEWRISAIVEVSVGPHHSEVKWQRSYHRMKNVLEYAPYFVYSNAPELFSRTPALVIVERKAYVLFKEERSSFGDALIGLGWHIITANEGREGVKYHHLTDGQERANCQQVGCSDTPVVTYRLKELQVSPQEGYTVKPEYDFTPQFTWYCEKHARRGDCGIEDSDSNLEVVK